MKEKITINQKPFIQHQIKTTTFLTRTVFILFWPLAAILDDLQIRAETGGGDKPFKARLCF